MKRRIIDEGLGGLEGIPTELIEEYRIRVGNVLEAIHGSDGSYEQSELCLRDLIGLEGWLLDNLAEFDINLSRHTLDNPDEGTIDSLLEELILRVSQHLLRLIYVLEANSRFLPPGTAPSNKGASPKKYEFKHADRLRALVFLLVENGISTDELMIVPGKSSDDTVRTMPYHILEIPGYNRQILVCDEIGEATFVIRGFISRETLEQLSKEELQDKFGPRIIKVPQNNKRVWGQMILEAVFGYSDPARMDLKFKEALRMEILEKCPTGKDWLKMNLRAKQNFKPLGKGMQAISSSFGLKGVILRSHVLYAELGARIYGMDDPAIATEVAKIEANREAEVERQKRIQELGRDPVKWKTEILKRYPTSKDLLKLTGKQRKEFVFFGKGTLFITGIFGMEGVTYLNDQNRAKFGAKIYGKDDELIAAELLRLSKIEEKLKELGDDPEKWKAEIIKRYPTSKDWLKLTVPKRKKINFHGIKITAIARIFGMTGDPKSNNKDFLELAAKIYGKDDELIAAELLRLSKIEEKLKELGDDPKKWVVEIKKRHPTSNDWIAIKAKSAKRGRVNFYGKGPVYLARIFGVEGNPAIHKVHVELGAQIYGEEDEHIVVEQKRIKEQEVKLKELGSDLGKWSEEIMLLYPTIEAWLNMNARVKNDFSLFGQGLTKIARLFGVDGDPRGYHEIHANLGRKIYQKAAF